MYRLIIADDEPLIRSGLYYRIDWNSMGYEVIGVVEDGQEVLDILEKKHVDVLLTDIRMFDVSGLEVARVVRDKYAWMKVILLSGYREFEYAKEAMHSKVYEYLLKPVDYEQLKEVFLKIREELDKSHHDELMLKSMGLQEYDQMLELLKLMNRNMLSENGDTWFVYARMKPLLGQMPQDIRNIFLQKMVSQLLESLWKHKKTIAERFKEKMEHLDFEGVENNQDKVSKLLEDLHDDIILSDKTFTNQKNQDGSINKACRYIHNHLGDDFTYRDVANFVHISPRHFIRRFKSEMNETFTDYVVRTRIEAAMCLLNEGLVQYSDVSRVVGYRDDKYFQQIFKKHVGCTVKEYITKHR